MALTGEEKDGHKVKKDKENFNRGGRKERGGKKEKDIYHEKDGRKKKKIIIFYFKGRLMRNNWPFKFTWADTA